VHSISIVYRVRPRSYDIKLDDQSEDWAWFKEIPARFKGFPFLLIDWHQIQNAT